MKKQMIVGIAIAVGMFSFGTFSASAADSGPSAVSCTDKQAYQQFVQETAGLADKLKKTDWELREQYNSSDSIDNNKVRELEDNQKELKKELNAAAQKYGISACCRS